MVDQVNVEEDLYEILGVKRKAKTEEIRRAFLARSRVIHPESVYCLFLHSVLGPFADFSIVSLANFLSTHLRQPLSSVFRMPTKRYRNRARGGCMIWGEEGVTTQVRWRFFLPSFADSSSVGLIGESGHRCAAGSPTASSDLGDETLNGVLRSVINEVSNFLYSCDELQPKLLNAS
jgi:hypothetical protein